MGASEIISLLGGRAAEELVIKDITTGASNDIERATSMARDMVTKYGMSELLGPIQFGGDNDEVFIGRDWGHARNYGEGVAATIDQEVNRIVTDAYREAKRLLQENIFQMLFYKRQCKGQAHIAFLEIGYSLPDLFCGVRHSGFFQFVGHLVEFCCVMFIVLQHIC